MSQQGGREHQAGGKWEESKLPHFPESVVSSAYSNVFAVKGSVKEGLGSMTGNTRMEAEGNVQKNAGKVRCAEIWRAGI